MSLVHVLPISWHLHMRLAEPKCGTALNCPVPCACFPAWVHVSVQLLMEGYFDPSKATAEREQNSINLNSGQEPGLRVQGSILWRLEFTAGRGERAELPAWETPNIQIVFSYQLLLNRESWWMFLNFILTYCMRSALHIIYPLHASSLPCIG